MIAQMMERLRAGDVRALARAVSVVEDGAAIGGGAAGGLPEVCGECVADWRDGASGGGEEHAGGSDGSVAARGGAEVGVVAVDPSSPYTGGALLGDRIRMQGFAGDAGVYIRSMASRGAMGGWLGGGGCLYGDGGGGAADDFD